MRTNELFSGYSLTERNLVYLDPCNAESHYIQGNTS